MKILFVAGHAASTVFPMVPLAQAVRHAGHEVFMAGLEVVLPAVTSAGFPGIPISSKALSDFRVDRRGETVAVPPEAHERDLAIGRMFGRLAADCLGRLMTFAEQWRPDVVVGAALAYASPLMAHHVGIPYIRFATDLAEPVINNLAAITELGPELEQLGLYEMPRPEFSISVAPESMRPADAPPALPMRHIPYNTQRSVEPWMYKTGERQRILVSAENGVTPDSDTLSGLVSKVAELDVELLIAAPETVTDKLQPLPDYARAGWLPLDVVALTCDLIVHHGDGSFALTCLANGLPQILIPSVPCLEDHSARFAERGAAKMIRPEDATSQNITQACRDVLGASSFRDAAAGLRDEIRGMPLPNELVPELERVCTASNAHASEALL